MKITDVQIIPLSYKIEDTQLSTRTFAVLKMMTDEGLVGWGEASDCYGHHLPLTVKAYVEEQMRWWLLDQDPLQLETVMAVVGPQVSRYRGNQDLSVSALSAAEIAMWDIRGKAEGKSVSELLGRYRNSIPLYAAGRPEFTVTSEQHVEWARPLLDRGVKAYKIRIGNTFEWDERFVREVRRLLPGDVRLFVDGKFNYTPDSAIRMAHVLADAGAEFFEEPVSDLDLDELERVARASPVPLAYGEHAFTMQDFRALITRRIARILNPDATICGGIRAALDVGKLAQTFGLRVEPHCGGLTAIGLAANLHAAAAMPEMEIFEFDHRPVQPLRDKLPTEPIFAQDRIVDGFMPVPAGPGLGIEVNEEVFDEYAHSVTETYARTMWGYAIPHI